ncbi:MAG: hypothetical protein WCK14_05980 [Actinomycetota bacterium]
MAAVTPLHDPLLGGSLPRDGARRAAPVTQRTPRPELQVVPRRRRTASIMALGCMLLFAMLLGTVALQTRIAQNQLALDKTDHAVKVARERYDLLRRARAELRSPNRLAVEANRLGMVPADKGEFMTISPATVAHLMATSGWLANNPAQNSVSSLEQFGEVKAVAGGAP